MVPFRCMLLEQQLALRLELANLHSYHATAYHSTVRPVFESSIWKNGPRPWDILNFQRAFRSEHKRWLWDSRPSIRFYMFFILRIYIMRTDRILLAGNHNHREKDMRPWVRSTNPAPITMYRLHDYSQYSMI